MAKKIDQKTILIVVLLIALLLCVPICAYFFKSNVDDKEELYKSQGRVEELEKKIDQLDNEKLIITNQRDSIKLLLLKKPKERIVIVKKYEKRISDIDNHSADTTLQRITDRLNGILPSSTTN